jgi:ABC-type transport system substrate-binding protein
MLLAVAMACGSAEPAQPSGATAEEMAVIVQEAMAAQQPGVTSEEMAAAIQSAMQAQQPGVTSEDVASEIAKALAAQPGGVTSEEMASAISSAMAEQPGGVTSQEMASAISSALAEQPGGVTSEEMASAIANALAEQPGGVTSEEMASAIANALAEQPGGVTSDEMGVEIAKALAAQPGGVTEEQMAMAVESALMAQPGVSQEDIQMAVESAVAAAVQEAVTTAFAQAGEVEVTGVTGQAMVNPNAKYGGTLTIADYLFPGLNHHPYEFYGHQMNINSMHGKLIEFNPETEDRWDIRGDLAKSWEVAGDGVTYTFNLDERATWHDGLPVTAEDVVYSLDAMQDPDTDRPRPAFTQLDPFYKQGNSRALDQHTVQVTIENPSGEFLPTLSLAPFNIIAKHWDESDIDTTKWSNSMGAGPFLPGEIENDVSMELIKNPDYWKEGFPYVDRIQHFVITESGPTIAAFRTGRVLTQSWLVTPISNKEAVRLGEEEPDKLDVVWSGSFGPAGMFMTVNPPFNDLRIRQAFNLVFDRHEFVEVFGAGPGTDLAAPYYGVDNWYGYTAEEVANAPGYRQGPNGEKHPDDIAEAKRLIAEWEADHPNGFEATDTTDPWIYTPGEGHKFTMMTRISGDKVSWAELQLEQLRRFLDIDGTLTPIDSAAGISRYNAETGYGGAGDYLIAAQDIGMLMTPGDQTNFINGFEQTTKWLTELAPQWFKDAMVEQRTEQDPEKRKEIVRKMQKYLIEEDPGPLLTLWHSVRPYIVNKKLQNFHMAPTIFAQLKWEHVWIEE